MVLNRNYYGFKTLLFITSFIGVYFFFAPISFAYSQNNSALTSASSMNSNIQMLGTALSGSLNTITIKVVNDSGSTITVSSSTSITVIEYDTLAYTCTYPCTSNKWLSSSVTFDPPARYSGGGITSGTGAVTMTATFTGKTFNSTKYYLLGYFASNNGNRLKVLGSGSDLYANGVYRSDMSANYLRVDQIQSYSATGNGVSDMYFAINGDLGTPTFINSGSENVDILNGTITTSLSGDLLEVGSAYNAKVEIQAICTDSNGTYDNPYYYTQIFLDADSCRTSMLEISPFRYDGYQYCASTHTTTWKADNVKLHYQANGSCTYPVEVCLSKDSGWSGYDNCYSLGNLTIGTDTSGSGFSATEPSTSDPIAWLGWKIQKVLFDLFSFTSVDFTQLGALKTNAYTRVPFAYADSVFNMDWTSPVTSGSAPPSMNFAFAYTGGGLIAGSYNYVPSSGYTGLLAQIRPVITVVLWLGLLLYIINRVRGLVHSL